MKKSHKIAREKSVNPVVHLTISFPADLAARLRTEKNYSNLLADLYRAHIEKKDATPQAVKSPEEIEIVQALKERERLIALYDEDKIYDVEYVIRKGRDTDDVEIANWHDYYIAKGVEDPNGYFVTYEKCQGRHVEETLMELWHDVKAKFNKEEEKLHETALNREIANGMTLQDALNRMDAYMKHSLDEKIEKLKAEAKEVKDEPYAGASTYMERKRINEKIDLLTKRFRDRIIFYGDIMNGLGLSYADAYQKVAPALRREGYTIIEKGKKGDSSK